MKGSRFGWWSLACVGAMVTAGSALAGALVQQDVDINDGLRTASGSVGWVHDTDDRTQFIGCSSTAVTGASATAVCFAHSLANKHASCTTAEPEFVATVRSIRADSYLSFKWRVDSADPSKIFCVSIMVENGSHGAQKH